MADIASLIETLWATYATIAASPAAEWDEGGHSAKMADLKKIHDEIDRLEARQLSESGESGRIFKPIAGAYE